MFRDLLSGLLIFIAMMIFMREAVAADDSFSKRAANMAEIKDLRYSLGSGRVRVVLDLTKKVEFDVNYLESPSRMVIDIDKAWISSTLPKEFEIKSTAASKLRIAQFNPSKVRLVIETSAENNVFILDGGPAGKRLVIDIGAEAELPGFENKVDEPVRPIEPVDTEPVDISKVPEGVPTLTPEGKSEGNKDKSDKNEKKDKKEKKDKSKKKDKTDKSENDINKKLEELTTLEGKKIVLDPGHGGNDSGAIGPSGVMEKTVTLKVALELEKLLLDEGAEVVMTRRTDVEVAPKGRAASDIEELKSRCDIANREKADIFISIHADSFSNPAARGTTAYYFSKGSPESKKLAECIRAALIDQIKTPSRGTQPCNFYVVRNTDMPATLIELAFISNPQEESLLNSKEGVQKAAQGIFDGIEDYFG